MRLKEPLIEAGIGFLGYGALSFVLTHEISWLAACAGALVHGGFCFLLPLPWRRYFNQVTQQACVTVNPNNLTFGQVSLSHPEKWGFIKVHDMSKTELFEKLKGKKLNPATIPLHMRVILEEKRMLETSWEAIQPHLVGN